MVTEYPLTNKLPAGWDKFIRFIKKAGAIATVGAVITGGTVGGLYIRQQFSTPGVNPPASPGTANEWVNTSAGASPSRCSPACSYDSTHAYNSLNAAYIAASGGDTIYTKAGSYGAQTIAARSIGTSVVTVSSAPGETVNTGAIEIDTSYITINGFNVGNNQINAGGGSCTRTGVTISNNVAAGSAATITASCGNVSVIGNDVSGTNQCSVGGQEDAVQFYGQGTFGAVIPSNIIVRGNYIHDMAHAFGSCGAHADGLQAFGCQNCTIENNRFSHDDTSDIIIYAPNSGVQTDIQNILIQNNSFGQVDEAGHGVSIGGNGCSGNIPTNVILQNNTWYDANTTDINCTGGFIAATVRNNIFAVSDSGFACFGAIANFDYNVFAAGGCGTHSTVCSPSFVSSTHVNGNVDLNSGDTCAKNYIPTSVTFPSTDIHGVSRPQGTNVDAGAMEVVGG